MWKNFDKEELIENIINLNLITDKNMSTKKKIKILYAISNRPELHYIKSTIPKRSGGYRKLSEPDYLLKTIQNNILHNILEEQKISKYATAYHKNLSIKNNAKPHINKNIVLKLDIKNFFDSITYEMIYTRAFSNTLFPPPIRTLLTNLCCYNFVLPQGTPTSGYISNLVMKPFDEYIGLWCEKNNISYTRYCDDMTFSGNFNSHIVKNKVKSFLIELGFELNEKKTKILKKGQRQNITGIIVNNKMQVAKQYRNNIRQEIYYIKKYGLTSHLKHTNSELKEEKYLKILQGKINFVLDINPGDIKFKEYKKYIKKLINNYEK